MKLTLGMLKEYVETSRSAEEIGDLLTMTGFELEGIETVEGEPVLDISIMANRGDAASVLGLARELLAKDPESKPTELYERAQSRFARDEGPMRSEEFGSVEIETPSCTRFSFRIFEDVENGPSPEWLQKQLRQIGQRPISLLVDLTNIVMMEVGQPMHAYDLPKVAGQKIIVRQAKEGEKLTTLDGEERELNPGHMIIADTERAIGIAGVMGGLDTEVSATTKTCLLESAHFSNISVRATRTELGMHTEASYRFERHVDPAGTITGLNRFAELYAQITGKEAVSGVVDLWPNPPMHKEVSLDLDRANELLGMEVPEDEARGALKRLGFDVREEAVGVPTWRSDIEREEDLTEEIGRVYGYDRIPEALPAGSVSGGGLIGAVAHQEHLRQRAMAAGLDEAVCHTLGMEHPLDKCAEKTRVRTPHSPEMAELRCSILPGLAQTAARNGGQAMVFEAGHVFMGQREWPEVGILMAGSLSDAGWHGRKGDAGFYDLKGVIEAMEPGATYEPSDDERLHPTRQARIMRGGEPIGVMGELDPLVAEQCGLEGTVCVAEIDIDASHRTADHELAYTPISRNPAARRDIAVVAKKSVSFADLEGALKHDLLEDAWLFDVYEGKGIEPDERSLAIALQLRKMGGNLTDEEANQARDQIVQALAEKGARLR